MRDRRGYEIFSSGEIGRAHVAAHRFLDARRHVAGREFLGRWLALHADDGPRWVHLQWHLLVFELGEGNWRAAHRRFVQSILPHTQSSDRAVTDGPQALLRLCWAAPSGTRLGWKRIAQAAVARLARDGRPFRVLHDLVAAAGARDLGAIDWWLKRKGEAAPPGLKAAAIGLYAFSTRDDVVAVRRLSEALPHLSNWGGSEAQNELFHEMLRVARRRRDGERSFRGSQCLTGPTPNGSRALGQEDAA
jgi:hypothetical protein